MADASKKQLVFNFIEFLRTSAQDGTVKEDDKESLEVAVQCIAEAFGVDPESDSDKSQYSIAPASLLSLLDVYRKTRAKSNTSNANPAAGPSTSASTPTPSGSSGPSAADKAKAEELKSKGNSLMSQKLYDSAIEQYTQAIKLDANPIYYSNRAAAWGGLGEHEKAVEDAESALSIDPKFAKAFSRLGHAQFSLGEYSAAIEAYESGLKLDPNNANMKAALSTAKSRQAETSSSPASREPPRGAGTGGAGGMPDLSALASMLGGGGGGGGGAGGGGGGMPDLGALAGMFGGGEGAGGGGGGGGGPDIASMLRNPQMMQMAQQMMANGGLERLMSNPNIRQMAENMQNGGGMPDLSQLQNDPNLRDMAQQFMGGQGGQGGQGRDQ